MADKIDLSNLGDGALVKSHEVDGNGEKTVMRTARDIKALNDLIVDQSLGCNSAAKKNVFKNLFAYRVQRQRYTASFTSSSSTSGTTATATVDVVSVSPFTITTETIVMVDDDTIGGPATVILPTPSDGTQIAIKKLGTTGNVTITPSTGLIDGQASVTIATQYESITVVSDGTNWFIV